MLKKSRDELQEKLTAKKMEITQAENNISNCTADYERFTARSQELKQKIDANAAEIESNKAQINDIERAIEKSVTNVNKIDAGRIDEIKVKLSNLDKHKLELQQNVSALDADREGLMSEIQTPARKSHKTGNAAYKGGRRYRENAKQYLRTVSAYL